jgi:response regulator RpfG family c-di-GMP phosphodiesterase
MVSSRNYREALTPDQAYKEIMRCSGRQYDPDVVKSFKGVWDEIRANLGNGST